MRFIKNKSTFCFVLQILFVSLQYRKGDKRPDHLPQIPLLLLLGLMFNLKYKIMEVLLNLQNKNVTLNAVHVAPEGTNCCNRLKVHFDVFQETAKKAAIIRLSTANSFELIHYQDKHIALLIPFDRIQKISY